MDAHFPARMDKQLMEVGQALGLHIRRSSAESSGRRLRARWPRWTIALALAGSRRSRWKRKPGWHGCRAGRRKSWVIRMNCGPRGCSPATLASTVPPKGNRAWRTWKWPSRK